jgi:hypothetical protein
MPCHHPNATSLATFLFFPEFVRRELYAKFIAATWRRVGSLVTIAIMTALTFGLAMFFAKDYSVSV